MDSTPEDEVLAISRFLSKLQISLQEEAETTLQIESELEKLGRDSDLSYNNEPNTAGDIKQHDPSDLKTVLPPQLQEEQTIRDENIRLLLALQRQDYVTSSYEKLLVEYQDLMESINNSIVNRNNYLEVKKINDELQFKDKCSKLEDEIEALKLQNKSYDHLFDSTFEVINQNLKTVKDSLNDIVDHDEEVKEMLEKLDDVQVVIESEKFLSD